ncbi:ABC transporter ATP-binding protein [Corynebacterium epidermidicanis]|uniref:ABC transporter, ATP-binding protein n=1 Tax=Corynebacterium epidermidicanis TaxID=1050174 RepID=A0A0G3GVC3_9CORY|nr:ABC transporter ATP-binding protein [Corynebacterium epidermidicanis]AKK02792.1 ABC transporter, ATP-binding protein [Corynebacterium epidermidicanis]
MALSSKTPAIHARDFSWRHAGRKKATLTGLNFDIVAGERVLILGASGSGKSTLLAAIAGVLGGPDDGEFHGTLEVAGIDARDTQRLRGRVGMLLQDPDSQVIASKVGDDVAFGCENLGMERSEIWRRVTEALALVGLDLPLDHPTSALSGGQKQRLALAGIIAMGADIIVLDEPTANIDPVGIPQLVAAVSQLTGATVIVVEHRVETWKDLVDRAIVLGSDGTVHTDGPVEQVLWHEATNLAHQGIWVPESYLPPESRLQHVAKLQRPPSNGEAAVQAQGLQIGWDAQHPVGGERDLRIPLGQSTVITGRNGAGKSTLALTLAGLLPPLSGDVSVHPEIAAGIGQRPHAWSARQLSARIGFVFQDPEHQFLTNSVREELLIAPAIVAQHAGPKLGRLRSWRRAVTNEMESRADQLLADLRLEHLAAASPFSLSGGQKRRLSVATALMLEPEIVFLDEPTFGQDRRTFLEIIRLLTKLRDSGRTMVSITHDPLVVELLADNHLEVA